MDYDLSCIKRYGGFPAKIASVALREANDYIHHHARSESIFLAFILSIEEKEMLLEHDGIEKRIASVPYTYLVLPGTVIHTLLPSRRHELFFRYSPEIKPFFDSLRLHDGPFHFSPEFNDKFQSLKQCLNKIKTPGMADRIDLLAIDLACEARLAAQIPGMNNSNILPVPDERIFNVAKFLEANYNKSVTITEQIKRQNMTIRTFNREWKKYFNMSPNQYLITLRIEKAKKLLSESTFQISQIAEHCGFCDVMYFTRCFKNKVGIPPGVYRKQP